jgi:RNA12 protein/RNA recognition motif. (a.k.a. RRM, RBD, or RNP domain)
MQQVQLWLRIINHQFRKNEQVNYRLNDCSLSTMRALSLLRHPRCRHVIPSCHVSRTSAGFALIRHNSTTETTTSAAAAAASAKTTDAITGDLQQGHIHVAPDEEVLFINSMIKRHAHYLCFYLLTYRLDILPLRLQWLYRLLWLGDTFSVERLLKHVDKPSYAAADHWAIVQRALPPNLNVQVKQVLPRLSEGGLFIKYSVPPSGHERKTKGEIAAAVDAYLEQNPIRPWFNPFDRVGVGRVLGKPWIEDMYHLPSPKVKVEFLSASAAGSVSVAPTSASTSPGELTPEALYSIFRRYGKIKDIERQPADSKILPKYAVIEFTRIKYAILARSCIHGITIPGEVSGGKDAGFGTVLKVSYERKIKAHWIREWLFNHPRIVIPAIAALIAGITVIIFDPIRTFFIKIKVKYLLNTDDNQPLWSWIRKEVRKANFLSFKKRSEKNVLRAIWDDRKEEITQIQSWLVENGNTFIVVQGPHGSGKKEIVVDQALKDRNHKLIIDCKQIQEARGDAQTISVAAQQVGYRPIFSWMNSISSFIDLASQAVIGTKAGFSETLDSQLSKIWTNTGTALRQIALENRRKGDRDIGLSDEEYLEAHPEKRPVVVIDNFLHGAREGIVYEKISEWAAALVTSNVAHVIFLTQDASYSKSLGKALPNQVFRLISLGDCSLEVGRNFILRYLQHREGESENRIEEPEVPPEGLQDLDECIHTVGGRLTDLEFMAHRIKSGESPKSKPPSSPLFFNQNRMKC